MMRSARELRCPFLGAERRKEILERYASYLGSLARLEPLAMPRVEDHHAVLAGLLRTDAR
jgi:hypothetical protein